QPLPALGRADKRLPSCGGRSAAPSCVASSQYVQVRSRGHAPTTRCAIPRRARPYLDTRDLVLRLGACKKIARRDGPQGLSAHRDEKGRPMPLKKTDLKHFKEMLEEKRTQIIQNAQSTLAEDMTLDANDLPDEMDLASSEYLQSFTFRLRGREKVFLEKI